MSGSIGNGGRESGDPKGKVSCSGCLERKGSLRIMLQTLRIMFQHSGPNSANSQNYVPAFWTQCCKLSELCSSILDQMLQTLRIVFQHSGPNAANSQNCVPALWTKCCKLSELCSSILDQMLQTLRIVFQHSGSNAINKRSSAALK